MLTKQQAPSYHEAPKADLRPLTDRNQLCICLHDDGRAGIIALC